MSTQERPKYLADNVIYSKQWVFVVRDLLELYGLEVKDGMPSSILGKEFKNNYKRLEELEYLKGKHGSRCSVSFHTGDLKTTETGLLKLGGGVLSSSANLDRFEMYQSFVARKSDVECILLKYHLINTTEQEDCPSTASDTPCEETDSQFAQMEQTYTGKRDFFARPDTEYPKIKETVMPTKTIANVTLIDPTAGILPEDSIIHSFGEFVYDGNTSNLQLTIATDAIHSTKLREALTAHNKKRAGTINLDILNRTGNKVMLEPLRITEVEWVIR